MVSGSSSSKFDKGISSPRLADGLDQRLLTSLRTWFATNWAFQQIYFHTFEGHQQQIDLLEESGLQQVGQLHIAKRGSFLLYR